MDQQVWANLHGDPNARDRNQDHIPVYGQDQIQDNNDNIIAQDDNNDDDIIVDDDGVVEAADVTLESINQQWKHVQAKTREMEKERQALRAERKSSKMKNSSMGCPETSQGGVEEALTRLLNPGSRRPRI